jgi:hypothetical protein
MRKSSANSTEFQNLGLVWHGSDSHKKQHDKNGLISTSCVELLSVKNRLDGSTIPLSSLNLNYDKRQDAAINLVGDIFECLAFAFIIATFAALISISDSIDAFIMGAQ